jgi:hypothetical protein
MFIATVWYPDVTEGRERVETCRQQADADVRVQESQYDDGRGTTDSHWIYEVGNEANGIQGSI